MEAPRKLHLKTLIMILIMVLAGPLGNVLLGKAMKQVGPVSLWPPSELLHAFTFACSPPAQYGSELAPSWSFLQPT